MASITITSLSCEIAAADALGTPTQTKVFGHANSTANAYCAQAKQAFHAICQYTVTTTQPTCTEQGVIGYTCPVCDHAYTEKVDAIGHNEVVDAAVVPTCTEAGLTAGSHCAVCREVLVAQTAVPALGHSYSYADNGDGTHTVSCTNTGCDASNTEAHTFVDGTCVCGAKDMHETYTFTLYRGDTQISNTLHWSIEAYVKECRSGEKEAITSAMLVYGNEAAAYFG